MKSKTQANQIRIIGGQWRGRKLPVADVTGLRPTMERVRETLFNWLTNDVRNARCLDLFAGSGALGLEALSRGAESVTFVDQSSDACRLISQNLDKLGAQARAKVEKVTAERFLQSAFKGPFDIVFLDPPFDSDLLPTVCDTLHTTGLLVAEAQIYLEWRKRDDEPSTPHAWSLHRKKTAGETAYALFRMNR